MESAEVRCSTILFDPCNRVAKDLSFHLHPTHRVRYSHLKKRIYIAIKFPRRPRKWYAWNLGSAKQYHVVASIDFDGPDTTDVVNLRFLTNQDKRSLQGVVDLSLHQFTRVSVGKPLRAASAHT